MEKSPLFLTCLCGVRVVHVVKLHAFTFLVPCCDVRYDNNVRVVLTAICFVGGSLSIYVICMYSRYWSLTRFLYQMMFVSFNSNTTDVICGAGPANRSGVPEFTHGF